MNNFKIINHTLQDLNESIYSNFLSDTVNFMTTTPITISQSIPTACLLTGYLMFF